MVFTGRIPYQALVDRPRLVLPDNARLAVWVIVNVEEWSIDRAMPRMVLPPPMGTPLLPDVPNWSWHEYGMRAGFWRQYEALTARGIRTTLAINGSACQSYSRVASAAHDASWEFMGHGFLQGPMHKLDDQDGAIRKTIEAIARFTGRAPKSWESPGLTETEVTLDLLRKNGIENVADWVIDDLPQDVATKHGTITLLPYTVELNDVVMFAVQQHESDQFLKRGMAQFDRLYKEGAANARIMAISIHPYLTGVAHRIRYLEELLDYILGHRDVITLTASEVGSWYRREMARVAAGPVS